MEAPQLAPPPLSATAAAIAAANVGYADSVESSPHARNADSWDEHPFPSAPAVGGAASKLRLMCSYGGHIVPRPHDKVLCYVGGDTRIVVSDRNSTLGDLSDRLSKTLLGGRCFTLKYQLPNEDLDSLISITSDEDLENMIDEYDRLAAAANNPQKSSRLRLFLFPTKPDSASSIGSLLENSSKSEDWFLNALNGANGGFSESASVNSLLGLDYDSAAAAGNGNSATAKEAERNSQLDSFGNGNKQTPPDAQSVPDSPMMEKNSSFDSTSSAPALANLPPIRVHVDDRKPSVGTIEDQFAQVSVSSAAQKQEEGGFVVMSSPQAVLTSAASPIAPAPLTAVGYAGVSGEYTNRGFNDDDRSEQGVPIGYRLVPQTSQLLPQQLQKPTIAVAAGGVGADLGSPDSVSSDGSLTNPLSRQRPIIYQDPSRVHVYPVDPKLSDPNLRVQMQQFQDSGYVMPTQVEQFNQQQNHQFNLQQQQQQLNSKHQQDHQLQQQLQQQHQQQQQPLFQGGGHYIQHHPAGAVPMSSYYPMFPPQQQPIHQQIPLDQQQYQMYYVPRQAQAYNLQQPNYTDAVTAVPVNQTQPPPSAVYTTTAARNAPASQPDTGVYRAASAAPQLVQVPSSQRQPQYVAPTSAAYPVHPQMYYPQQQQQPMAPQMYQTMTSAPMVGLAEATSQLPLDNMKQQQQQQQVRTLQP